MENNLRHPADSCLALEHRHVPLLWPPEISLQNRDAHVAFVQALWAQLEFCQFTFAAGFGGRGGRPDCRFPGAPQPNSVARVAVEIQQRIGLPCHPAAQVTDQNPCLPNVPCGAFGEFEILFFTDCLIGLGPQKHVPGTAVAPSRNGSPSRFVVSVGKIPLPLQTATHWFGAFTELLQPGGKRIRTGLTRRSAPTQRRVEESGPSMCNAEVPQFLRIANGRITVDRLP